ncbi:hypothetical protein [Streptomyces sp. NPDC058657]|uniref:hypothetical protein n=1 Tax=unclassified Streptomyces TaxID=2593676 RepID=UPI00366844F2
MTEQTPSLRDRIRRACAEADGFRFESLEPHDYQKHADALLALHPVGADRAELRDRIAEVWTVWAEDESTLGHYSDEVTAKLAAIEFHQETETPGLEFVYGWHEYGGRLELIAGGDDTGLRVRCEKVRGTVPAWPGEKRAGCEETTLRARIAQTLADADGWQWAEGWDKTKSPSFQEYLRHADAVLAVLPAGADRATAVLARVRSWMTSDVVTARSEFGEGYREAQRDIRDLLDGGRLADEAERQPGEAPAPATVHACPGPDDNGISPCCCRPPFEMPRGERITRDPDAVTCTGTPAEGSTS